MCNLMNTFMSISYWSVLCFMYFEVRVAFFKFAKVAKATRIDSRILFFLRCIINACAYSVTLYYVFFLNIWLFIWSIFSVDSIYNLFVGNYLIKHHHIIPICLCWIYIIHFSLSIRKFFYEYSYFFVLLHIYRYTHIHLYWLCNRSFSIPSDMWCLSGMPLLDSRVSLRCCENVS